MDAKDARDEAIRDLIWCIQKQATISFAGFGEAHHATVSLPGGVERQETASGWRRAVAKLKAKGY